VIIEIIRSFRSKVNTAACYRCHISSLQRCIKEKSNRKR